MSAPSTTNGLSRSQAITEAVARVIGFNPIQCGLPFNRFLDCASRHVRQESLSLTIGEWTFTLNPLENIHYIEKGKLVAEVLNTGV